MRPSATLTTTHTGNLWLGWAIQSVAGREVTSSGARNSMPLGRPSFSKRAKATSKCLPWHAPTWAVIRRQKIRSRLNVEMELVELLAQIRSHILKPVEIAAVCCH